MSYYYHIITSLGEKISDAQGLRFTLNEKGTVLKLEEFRGIEYVEKTVNEAFTVFGYALDRQRFCAFIIDEAATLLRYLYDIQNDYFNRGEYWAGTEWQKKIPAYVFRQPWRALEQQQAIIEQLPILTIESRKQADKSEQELKQEREQQDKKFEYLELIRAHYLDKEILVEEKKREAEEQKNNTDEVQAISAILAIKDKLTLTLSKETKSLEILIHALYEDNNPKHFCAAIIVLLEKGSNLPNEILHSPLLTNFLISHINEIELVIQAYEWLEKLASNTTVAFSSDTGDKLDTLLKLARTHGVKFENIVHRGCEPFALDGNSENRPIDFPRVNTQQPKTILLTLIKQIVDWEAVHNLLGDQLLLASLSDFGQLSENKKTIIADYISSLSSQQIVELYQRNLREDDITLLRNNRRAFEQLCQCINPETVKVLSNKSNGFKWVLLYNQTKLQTDLTNNLKPEIIASLVKPSMHIDCINLPHFLCFSRHPSFKLQEPAMQIAAAKYLLNQYTTDQSWKDNYQNFIHQLRNKPAIIDWCKTEVIRCKEALVAILQNNNENNARDIRISLDDCHKENIAYIKKLLFFADNDIDYFLNEDETFNNDQFQAFILEQSLPENPTVEELKACFDFIFMRLDENYANDKQVLITARLRTCFFYKKGNLLPINEAFQLSGYDVKTIDHTIRYILDTIKYEADSKSLLLFSIYSKPFMLKTPKTESMLYFLLAAGNRNLFEINKAVTNSPLSKLCFSQFINNLTAQKIIEIYDSLMADNNYRYGWAPANLLSTLNEDKIVELLNINHPIQWNILLAHTAFLDKLNLQNIELCKPTDFIIYDFPVLLQLIDHPALITYKEQLYFVLCKIYVDTELYKNLVNAHHIKFSEITQNYLWDWYIENRKLWLSQLDKLIQNTPTWTDDVLGDLFEIYDQYAMKNMDISTDQLPYFPNEFLEFCQYIFNTHISIHGISTADNLDIFFNYLTHTARPKFYQDQYIDDTQSDIQLRFDMLANNHSPYSEELTKLVVANCDTNEVNTFYASLLQNYSTDFEKSIRLLKSRKPEGDDKTILLDLKMAQWTISITKTLLDENCLPVDFIKEITSINLIKNFYDGLSAVKKFLDTTHPIELLIFLAQKNPDHNLIVRNIELLCYKNDFIIFTNSYTVELTWKLLATLNEKNMSANQLEQVFRAIDFCTLTKPFTELSKAIAIPTLLSIQAKLITEKHAWSEAIAYKINRLMSVLVINQEDFNNALKIYSQVSKYSLFYNIGWRPSIIAKLMQYHAHQIISFYAINSVVSAYTKNGTLITSKGVKEVLLELLNQFKAEAIANLVISEDLPVDKVETKTIAPDNSQSASFWAPTEGNDTDNRVEVNEFPNPQC